MRASRWIAVGAALGLLGALGVAVRDDYGLTFDNATQRDLGHATLHLVLGDVAAFKERLGPNFAELRYYGAAFEMPLALVERALGQAGSRDVYLTRHLLTHFAFLVGAGAAALLAHRLFGGIWPALLALSAFALHPRLYAHSFFNSKDAPFAALFMVCLALAERAFRRNAPGAYALLGVGVGALVNLRVMGALLFAVVLAMLVLELALAGGREARRNALAGGAAFATAAALALYAVSPYLWPDPSRLLDAIAFVSQHPIHSTTLFAGTLVRWPDIPAHYVPTWMAVTTPPALLALCLAGAAAALGRGLASLGGAVRATSPRFGLLLVACPVLTVAAIAAVNANVHNGWRQLHFLWAPASLLIVAGLKWLAGTGRRLALRRGLWGLATVGVTAGIAQLALLHPHQHSYFNLSVDRDAPERLASWYGVDFLRMSYYNGLRQALQRHPAANVKSTQDMWDAPRQVPRQLPMLPEMERRRVAGAGPLAVTTDILAARRADRRGCGGLWPAAGLAAAHLAIKIYNNTCFTARALDEAFMDAASAETLRTAYQAAAAAPPLMHSGYDLHLGPSQLTLLKEPCGGLDLRGEFVFTAFRATGGAEVESVCRFADCGVRVGNACMVHRPLPAGPLGAIVTSQRLRADGPDLWRVAVEFRPAGVAAADATRPAVPPLAPLSADAPFDLYLDGATLVYARESCRPEDTRPRFFLHAFPNDPSTLPEERRDSGFHNLDFKMEEHDAALLARLDGRCVAWRRLPGEGGEGIAHLRTGQIGGAGGRLWLAEFAVPGKVVPAGLSSAPAP